MHVETYIHQINPISILSLNYIVLKLNSNKTILQEVKSFVLMMAAVTITVLVTTLLCILSTASYGRVIVGAKTEIADVSTNMEVQELGKFAVEEYNYKQGLNNGGGVPLKFVEVVEAEQQVVSGMKYYLNISATDSDGAHRMFTSVVVVKPWLHEYKKVLHFGPLSTIHQLQYTM